MLCNFVSFVQCPPKGRHARLKILREGVVELWCKTKGFGEEQTNGTQKQSIRERNCREVVVVLLLLSCELFFFALFRAFVGVVRDVSSNKGRHLGKEVSISS